MTERLLQFIWKHRYFNQQKLLLAQGESLCIEYPGEENHHQGPDFIHARIRIDDTLWVGSIELHLLSSGWNKHGHAQDDNYSNVILHVVWKQDMPDISRNIPQLELANRVSRIMLDTYTGWMNQPAFVPCENALKKCRPAGWDAWKEKLLVMRLERKRHQVLLSLRKNHYHWEEQFWWMIAGNFGMKVNATVFEMVARSIPFPVLARHRHQRIQLEALLFGQANLLEGDFTEEYPSLLKKEFQFLKTKYGLKKVFGQVHFLRMRPENFPTIRLSQLAGLYAASSNLFACMLKDHSLAELRKRFILRVNDYWFYHYVFDKPSRFKEKLLGRATGENMLINSFIPLLYTYSHTYPNPIIRQKALSWLREIRTERNTVISGWKGMGIKAKSAAESQALLELKKGFCDPRKCLDCDIGKSLLTTNWVGNPDEKKVNPLPRPQAIDN